MTQAIKVLIVLDKYEVLSASGSRETREEEEAAMAGIAMDPMRLVCRKDAIGGGGLGNC